MSNPASLLVSARSVGIQFHGDIILRGLDLDVEAGSHLAVTGRSGSGKTTLLLLLAGLLTPTEGTVTWPALPELPRERRASIGMVFQAPSLMPELTALENVTLPLRLRGTALAVAREAALKALATVGADGLAQARPSQLSGGQQQRVAIARAVAGGHRLVLADEPTGALDRVHAHEAALALRDAVAGTGGALVLATHDPDLAAMFDQRLAVVDGKLTTTVRS